ncbi:MAG TPA: PRC-barrel domain-containing protein [Clostridia bacterium]
MKKTQKILGLPIISISDGMEVGKVKSIIINAEKGAIDYIAVDSGIQIFSARVIATEDILGIGEYALTIENEDVITDISKIPSAIQLLQKDIRVKGTKVLTKKGSLIGEIGDIYVDENNGCRITGLEFIADITQKQIRLIPRDSVITFGKNLTVVTEDVESRLLDTPSQLDSDSVSFESEKKNITDLFSQLSAQDAEPEINADLYGDSAVDGLAGALDETAAITVGETGPEIAADADVSSGSADQPAEDDMDNASILFEQRQRQYLKGRYATKTITDNDGNVIIYEGMQIDDAVIDEAKKKGRLVELVMNNRA